MSGDIKIESVLTLVPVISDNIPHLVVVLSRGGSSTITPFVGTSLLKLNRPLGLLPPSVEEHDVLEAGVLVVGLGVTRWLGQTFGSELNAVTQVLVNLRVENSGL